MCKFAQPCVNLHNSMPAMNYFDSNRTNTVIFNHSWTVYTRHLVAVPFTSFVGIYFFYFISNNCSSVRYYVWQLRSAILLALEMMNEWTPTFFWIICIWTRYFKTKIWMLIRKTYLLCIFQHRFDWTIPALKIFKKKVGATLCLPWIIS
jgi:hypothetical protein